MMKEEQGLEEPPQDVQSQLPQQAQDLWLEAFNSAWQLHKDLTPKERAARSNATAWSAIRKAGWTKNQQGEWIDITPQPGALSKVVPQYSKAITQLEFSHIKINEDGSAIIKGVVPFAEGAWTDSASMTETMFTREEIAKTAGMWEGLPVWNNHPTNMVHEHDPTDHIGEMRNPRMDGGRLRVDIFAHGKTQASRDAIAMWDAGILPDLSAELFSTDIKKGDQVFGTNLRPLGVAWVLTGACDICKAASKGTTCPNSGTCTTHQSHVINSSERTEGAQGAGSCHENSNKGADKVSDEEIRIKELEAQLKESEGLNKELTTSKETLETQVKELKDAEAGDSKDVEELKKTLSETNEKIKDMETLKEEAAKLETRVKELEAQPEDRRSKVDKDGDGDTDGAKPMFMFSHDLARGIHEIKGMN